MGDFLSRNITLWCIVTLLAALVRDIATIVQPCARWLDHYFKTKCKVSGEDAPWKLLMWSNSKWPPICHYLLSHARYLVSRARWLDHYYETKCEVSGEDAHWKYLTWSNSKWDWPLFTFTCPIFVNSVRWLDHYHKTNFEMSGEDTPWNFFN